MMIVKSARLAVAAWLVIGWAAVVCPAGAGEPAALYHLSEVRVTDGPFARAQRVNLAHLEQYDPDRLLAPFLIAAGLEPKAERYPNWESTGLDGHTAGHYLSALAGMYAATGEAWCLERLEYMVAELARCQAASADGYIGGVPNAREIFRQVQAGDIRSAGFDLNGGWVPWYNLHKTYAGLRDAWELAGLEQAKGVLRGLCEWAWRFSLALNDGQMERMLDAEHGGMNEVFADAAAIFGDEGYLALARRFSHKAILDPLAAGEDRLTGLHANTQVPKVIGFARVASLSDRRLDRRYARGAWFFWETVTANRSAAFGGNSVREHFPALDDGATWLEHADGPETCNTHNMLRLAERLFTGAGVLEVTDHDRARLADYYERALFNHILASVHPEHGGYVYHTPVRPRHYRVYSQVGQCFWCCVGSGMENPGRYGQFIYGWSEGAEAGAPAVYVNLFVDSTLTPAGSDGPLLRQSTRFPEEPGTRLDLMCERPTRARLRIRRPGWAGEGFGVWFNGQPVQVSAEPGAYVELDRVWRRGDVVEVRLPMEVHAEALPGADDYAALLYGPVLLAAAVAGPTSGLVADDGRFAHIPQGEKYPLEDAPALMAIDGLGSAVRRLPGDELRFDVRGLVHPVEFEGLLLRPFYEVHDTRYMMYWRVIRPSAEGSRG